MQSETQNKTIIYSNKKNLVKKKRKKKTFFCLRVESLKQKDTHFLREVIIFSRKKRKESGSPNNWVGKDFILFLYRHRQ